LAPQSWGKKKKRLGGHPQTLGRDESLHSLVIPAKAGIQREAKHADSISIAAFDAAILGEEENEAEGYPQTLEKRASPLCTPLFG
jgi:hypothetical protein